MKKFLILTIFAMVSFSCQKELALKDVDFEVTVDGNTHYVGDTITFNFKGTPEFISFYSGEIGNDYDSIGGRKMLSDLYMSFRTHISSIAQPAQPDQLTVLISKDFSGNYTVEDVNAATWIDITDRFDMANFDTPEVLVPSGKANISDLNTGEPFYVAARYQQRPKSTHGTRCNWRFQDFLLEGGTDGQYVEIENFISANWKIVEDGPWYPNRIQHQPNNNRVIFLGHFTAEHGLEVNLVGWAISDPFVVEQSWRDFGPDKSVPIKALAEADKTFHQHVFNQPGTYKVTFVAANVNLNNRKEVVKQLEIVVLPKN